MKIQRSGNMVSFKEALLLIWLCSFFFPGSAQSPSQWNTVHKEYPDEDAVYLHWREKLNIGWEAGKLDITHDHDSRMLFLHGNSPGLAERAISYSSFSTILNIDASTQVPDKERYHKVPVLDIRDLNSISNGIFYDDRREKSFVFPSIQDGALADLKYREQILEPRFLGAFYFRSYLPVVDATYTVTVDTGISLRYKLLGRDTASILFRQEVQNGRRTYFWTAARQPSMIFEENAPALLYDEPHVVVYLDRVGNQSILGDVDGLYSWYRSLTDSLNIRTDSDLEVLTEMLVAGAVSDREKAIRIFSWVQDNIRYVAFEDGLGGFIPREATLVCQRKFGDCKDMASLLSTMLNMAGLTAKLTWIGTRDIPYRYDQVPTPLSDNHMIASLVLDGENYFLDATDDALGFGFPSSFIQGKQAMIGFGEDYKLITVPEVAAHRNLVEEKAHLTLIENQLTGTATARWQGYPAFDVKRQLSSVQPEGMPRFLSGALELGNNKFSVTRFSIAGQLDRNAPLEIEFDLLLPDYARFVGDQIFINMNLDRRLQQAGIDVENRKRDREFEYRSEHVHEVTLDIPAGYTVAYLPESMSVEQEYFGFQISYRIEENQIRMERKIRLDLLLLKKENFSQWNNMVNALGKAYRDVVVLDRLNPSED